MMNLALFVQHTDRLCAGDLTSFLRPSQLAGLSLSPRPDSRKPAGESGRRGLDVPVDRRRRILASPGPRKAGVSGRV
jgi:hypothetical protein